MTSPRTTFRESESAAPIRLLGRTLCFAGVGVLLVACSGDSLSLTYSAFNDGQDRSIDGSLRDGTRGRSGVQSPKDGAGDAAPAAGGGVEDAELPAGSDGGAGGTIGTGGRSAIAGSAGRSSGTGGAPSFGGADAGAAGGRGGATARDGSASGRGGMGNGGATGGTASDASQEAPCDPLGIQLITDQLKNPVYATAPAGDDRIFVLERLLGRILIVDGSGIRSTPFLDVSANMSKEGFEVGLLALVFHPEFAKNHAFFVSYTTTANNLRVSRFTVPSATPDVANPASESVIIEIPRASNHNTAGMLRFGPDGYLYIGVGDDDSEAKGQDLTLLNGKLLRIAVDLTASGHTIPPTNPFVGVAGVKPEIWAYGLREPFRFWFDSGELYIADVGDNRSEEIDVVPAAGPGGKNFGWPIMEGSFCHTPETQCDKSGLELPGYEFPHAGATAVIGGSVYHGSALSECYRGRYFFGSYSAGWVRSFRWDHGPTDLKEEAAVDPGFVSFGLDGQGEILLLGYDQTLYRLVAQ